MEQYTPDRQGRREAGVIEPVRAGAQNGRHTFGRTRPISLPMIRSSDEFWPGESFRLDRTKQSDAALALLVIRVFWSDGDHLRARRRDAHRAARLQFPRGRRRQSCSKNMSFPDTVQTSITRPGGPSRCLWLLRTAVATARMASQPGLQSGTESQRTAKFEAARQFVRCKENSGLLYTVRAAKQRFRA